MKELDHEHSHDLIRLQRSAREARAVVRRRLESLALAQVDRLLARSLSA